TEGGNVRCALKTPYRDGTTHVTSRPAGAAAAGCGSSPASRSPQRSSGFSRTSAGTPSPSIRRIRAVRRLRAICRFDLCTAEPPRRDGRVLACSRMREHFSIEREDSQTEPRHNGPLGRPALQVRDLRVSSHKIPSAHLLHPDSTLESLIRNTGESCQAEKL